MFILYLMQYLFFTDIAVYKNTFKTIIILKDPNNINTFFQERFKFRSYT